MLPCLLLLALAQPVTGQEGFDSKVAWDPVSDEGGLKLERRTVAGSSSYEYRVTTRTAVPVATLCETTFEWGTRGTDVPGLAQRKELASAPDERVVYDQFQQTLVSNRDYAITVKRWRDPDGVCRIRWWATNAKAPKLLDGWVRIEKLWGGWTFTTREGQTLLVYTQFSDPGGSIPAAFANGSQRDAAVHAVRAALAKGKAGAAR